MIVGKIHKGSGIGDQLFCYLAARVRAEDLNVPYGFVGKEFFKGKDFMKLDWGKNLQMNYHIEEPAGKLIIDDPHSLVEIKTPYFDPEFDFIPNGSVIDGYLAQDEKYFSHKLNDIQNWLETKPMELSDDLCIINFRGGEFAAYPDLFLTKDYWDEAIQKVKNNYENSCATAGYSPPPLRFEVHTDDYSTAQTLFPNFTIIQNIDLNWRSIRHAKHLIISNSAFAIMPALLNKEAKEIIAPRYWARRNTKTWSMPANYYKKFTYI